MTTSIFQIVADDNFWWLSMEREEDWDLLAGFGQGRISVWLSPRVTVEKCDSSGRLLLHPEIYYLAHDAMALTLGAVAVLRPFLVQNAQLLGLDCDEEPLRLVNVTTIVDALDPIRTLASRFPGSPLLAEIEVPFFRAEVVANLDLFRVQGIRRSSIYVSSRFVEACAASKLSGIGFIRVWQT